MNPTDPKFQKRIVLTRRSEPKKEKRKVYASITQRPALLSDLSLADWWELITTIMQNDFRDDGFIVLSGRRYYYELREPTDDDAWVLPAQPHYKDRTIIRYRWMTKAKKQRANNPKMILRDDIPVTPLQKPQ